MHARPRPRGARKAPAQLSPVAVELEPVRSPREVEAFVRFQLELYQGDPLYVPPIVAERKDFLDRSKNPFLRHCELAMFVARVDGRIAGRIAAVVDANYNQHHLEQTAFFGFFDCVNDTAVAAALFDAAERFAVAQGMKKLVGPVNLSTNYDCGLLVEGHDKPPAMMMPYNAPYYEPLLVSAGFKKAKDLFSYELSTAVAPPDRIVQAAEKTRSELDVRIRPIDTGNLRAELERIKQLYATIDPRNFAYFVPLTEEELEAFANRLKPLVLSRPEMCLFAEIANEPVALSLTLPDSNVALKAAGGKLTTFGVPVGLAKLLWTARNIDRVRVLLLGMKPAYRKSGLDALMFVETVHAARRLGYEGGEIGWTLEDNTALNRSIEAMGARRNKVFRLYSKPVGR